MKTKKQEEGCKSAEKLKVDKKNDEKKENSRNSKAKPTTRVRTIKEMFANRENMLKEKKAEEPTDKVIKSETIIPLEQVGTEDSKAADSPTTVSTKPKENKKPKKEFQKTVKTSKRPAKSMGQSIKARNKSGEKKDGSNDIQMAENVTVEEPLEEIPEVGEGCTLGSIVKLNFKSGVCPTARWGHTLTMINESEAMLIGGQGDKQQLSKDSCLMLDISRHRWKKPETSIEQGQKPEARMGHTAAFDPAVRSLYLYGGSKNKRWFNDVHVLDVDEMKWQVVKANGKAPTRAYHTATLYRNELWIFGGVFPQPDPQPDGCSNDIHVYSPVEESWYMPIVMGDKPAPRSGHSATLLQDRIVMFGGWDYPAVYNDLHVLDLTLVEWTAPKVNGTPPAPRSWHSSCALYGNRVLIHGGYDGNLALQDSFIFNLDTLTWTNIVIPNNCVARCGHTACCLPYKYDKDGKDDVIIFGGGDNDGLFFEDLLGLRVPIDT